MKHVTRILSLLALSITVFLAGCDKGDDNKKSKNDQQIEKLVGTWTAVEVLLETQDQEPDYDAFTLTISGNAGDDQLSYTTSGRPDKLGPWPASGNFTFGADPTTQLIRSGAENESVDINYSVNDTQLTMTFTYQGTGFQGGRTESITGNWSFSFIKP